MHRLEPFFSCSSVAVIGASESSSYGSGPYRTLEALGFSGQYYPVNPRRPQVYGHRAYPDVASIPGEIDLAVIVVSRDLVNPSLAAAADKGARAAVVISAGFVETDEHGAALQREMSALVVDRGLVLVGPNCFGVASVVNRCGGFTGSGLHESRVGNISVLSTLLEGTRGGHGVDRAALTTMLCTLAALMVQQPRIASVDLNPVFGYPDGVLAVDARVERQPLVDRVDN